MKQNSIKFYKNRGLKRIYALKLAAVVVWIILFGFMVPKAKLVLIIFVAGTFFDTFSLIAKYAITNDNAIECYHFRGPSKITSIDIDTITKILVKSHRMNVWYKLADDDFERNVRLELSAADMKMMIDELTKRNPNIIIS